MDYPISGQNHVKFKMIFFKNYPISRRSIAASLADGMSLT